MLHHTRSSLAAVSVVASRTRDANHINIIPILVQYYIDFIMQLTRLLAPLFGLLVGCAVAQPEGDGQQIGLDSETIDALAARASPVCRAELEAAVVQEAEISVRCKEELHSILLSLSDKYASSQQAAGAGDNGSAQAPPSGNTGLWIVLFVIIALGCVAAYAYYVNTALAEAGAVKEKKVLSKKKVCVLNGVNVFTQITTCIISAFCI